MDDLISQDSHFAFGKNWSAYAAKITAKEIAEAEKGLSRLLGGQRLDGQHFLDIGSGSGLHSLAALRLGAREVVAIDIDPDSVATTQAVLERHAPERGVWRVEKNSVFDLSSEALGHFDTVYSWGVLHHTGDMSRAIRCAADLVAPQGRFIFALYRRTWMDWFWKWEKRWYAHASEQSQRLARAIYITCFKLGLLATGRSFSRHVENYRTNRGMDFYHDVHDWMGGWPYESISSSEVEKLMSSLGLIHERSFVSEGRISGRNFGLFGSGCDEYVYQRPCSMSAAQI